MSAIPPADSNPPTPPNSGRPKSANSNSQTPENPPEISATSSSAVPETRQSKVPNTAGSVIANVFRAKQNIEEEKQRINFGKYVNEEMLRGDFKIFGSDPELAPGFIAALNETFEPSDLIQKIVTLFRGLPQEINQISENHNSNDLDDVPTKTRALFMEKISNVFNFSYNPISIGSVNAFEEMMSEYDSNKDITYDDFYNSKQKQAILEANKNVPKIISLIPALANELSSDEFKAFENYLEGVISAMITTNHTTDNTKSENKDPSNVLTILPLLFRLEAGIKTDLTLDNFTKLKIQEVLKKSIIQIIKSSNIDKKALLAQLEGFTTQDNALGTRELMSFILGQEGQKAIESFYESYELFDLIEDYTAILVSSGQSTNILKAEVTRQHEDFQRISLVKSLINPNTNDSRRNAWCNPINEISQELKAKNGIILTPRDPGIFQSVSDSSLSQRSTSDNLKPTKTMKFLEDLLQGCAFKDLYINGGIIPGDLIQELLKINLSEQHFHSKDQEEIIESRFIARIQEFFEHGDLNDLNTFLERQGVNFTNPSPSTVRFLNFMNTLKALSNDQGFKITFSYGFDKTKLFNLPEKSIFLGDKGYGLSVQDRSEVSMGLYTDDSAIDRISLFSKPPKYNSFGTSDVQKLVANCQFELAKEIDEPTGPCGAVATKIDQEFNQSYHSSIPEIITRTFPNFVVSITEDDDTEEDEIDSPQYSYESDLEKNLVGP
jgi:hypothetical protein